MHTPPTFAKTKTKENKMKRIIKTIATIIAVVAFLIAVGVVGNFDHDEYIEVNSKPTTKFVYNRH